MSKKDFTSNPALFLYLIPFLTIFGTYLMTFYRNNILIIVLLGIIGLVALLIGFNIFIHKSLYPLAVFIIAISLLYHMSLISRYASGYDLQMEYYLSNLVRTNGIWDPTIWGNSNAMLSLTMLAPIYSIILNMDITWVFKIIYPFLFSLVPLGLYRAFQKQTNDKIAFFSSFFFMSIIAFFLEMPTLARQEIAELFLVLLILLMIDKEMDKIKRSILLIIFGISLVISHYGTSYIYMFCLVSAWLCIQLFSILIKKYKLGELDVLTFFRNEKHTTISLKFVLLYTIFVFSWYMYLSSSSAFDTIVTLSDHVLSSISTDFLNPEASQGLYLMTSQPNPGILHQVNRLINFLNQIFIVIGCFTLLNIDQKGKNVDNDYAIFSMINVGLLFAGVTLPHFARSFNMVRLYQLTLLFLAPFCIIGSLYVLKMMGRIIRIPWTNKMQKNSLKLMSAYFVVFFLFQAGLVFYVAEGHSSFISLNSTAEWYYYNDEEVLGAMWLKALKDNSYIYADEPRWLLLYSRLGPERLNQIKANIQPRGGSYIYFGTRNVIEHEVAFRPGQMEVGYIKLEEIIIDRSKIYNNGGSEIYKWMENIV